MTATSVRCCIPFCPATLSGPGIEADDEWLCNGHWRLVGRWTRQRYLKVKNKVLDNGKTDEDCTLATWLWKRAKKQAIEKAVGIQ